MQSQRGNTMVPENAIGKWLAVVLRKKARAEGTHKKNYRVLEVSILKSNARSIYLSV